MVITEMITKGKLLCFFTLQENVWGLSGRIILYVDIGAKRVNKEDCHNLLLSLYLYVCVWVWRGERRVLR